jgi:hypothetical protein
LCPRVRHHISHLPEDSGTKLSEACQAQHWLHNMDPGLLTPMVCIHGQDFYTFEPVMLRNRHICIPNRWFTQGQEIYAQVRPMDQIHSSNSWIVCEDEETEVNINHLQLSFTNLVESYARYGLADPWNITGQYTIY